MTLFWQQVATNPQWIPHASGWRTSKSGKHACTRSHTSQIMGSIVGDIIQDKYAGKLIIITAVISRSHSWRILSIKLYSDNIQLQLWFRIFQNLYQHLIAMHVCDWVIRPCCSARLCNYCNHFHIECARTLTQRHIDSSILCFPSAAIAAPSFHASHQDASTNTCVQQTHHWQRTHMLRGIKALSLDYH